MSWVGKIRQAIRWSVVALILVGLLLPVGFAVTSLGQPSVEVLAVEPDGEGVTLLLEWSPAPGRKQYWPYFLFLDQPGRGQTRFGLGRHIQEYSWGLETAVSHDGRTMAVTEDGRHITLLDPRSLERIGRLRPSTRFARDHNLLDLRFSKDDRYLRAKYASRTAEQAMYQEVFDLHDARSVWSGKQAEFLTRYASEFPYAVDGGIEIPADDRRIAAVRQYIAEYERTQWNSTKPILELSVSQVRESDTGRFSVLHVHYTNDSREMDVDCVWDSEVNRLIRLPTQRGTVPLVQSFVPGREWLWYVKEGANGEYWWNSGPAFFFDCTKGQVLWTLEAGDSQRLVLAKDGSVVAAIVHGNEGEYHVVVRDGATGEVRRTVELAPMLGRLERWSLIGFIFMASGLLVWVACWLVLSRRSRQLNTFALAFVSIAFVTMACFETGSSWCEKLLDGNSDVHALVSLLAMFGLLIAVAQSLPAAAGVWLVLGPGHLGKRLGAVILVMSAAWWANAATDTLISLLTRDLVAPGVATFMIVVPSLAAVCRRRFAIVHCEIESSDLDDKAMRRGQVSVLDLLLLLVAASVATMIVKSTWSSIDFEGTFFLSVPMLLGQVALHAALVLLVVWTVFGNAPLWLRIGVGLLGVGVMVPLPVVVEAWLSPSLGPLWERQGFGVSFQELVVVTYLAGWMIFVRWSGFRFARVATR